MRLKPSFQRQLNTAWAQKGLIQNLRMWQPAHSSMSTSKKNQRMLSTVSGPSLTNPGTVILLHWPLSQWVHPVMGLMSSNTSTTKALLTIPMYLEACQLCLQIQIFQCSQFLTGCKSRPSLLLMRETKLLTTKPIDKMLPRVKPRARLPNTAQRVC